MPFRKRALGSLDYSGVNPDLLRFKKAFDRQLWQYHCFPVLCLYLGTDYARYVHYPRAYDLCAWEWKVIAGVGFEVAAALDVPVTWGGDLEGENFEPSLWSLSLPDLAGVPSSADDVAADAALFRTWRIVAGTHRSWVSHDRVNCPVCSWADGRGELGAGLDVVEASRPRSEAAGLISPRSLVEFWT